MARALRLADEAEPGARARVVKALRTPETADAARETIAFVRQVARQPQGLAEALRVSRLPSPEGRFLPKSPQARTPFSSATPVAVKGMAPELVGWLQGELARTDAPRRLRSSFPFLDLHAATLLLLRMLDISEPVSRAGVVRRTLSRAGLFLEVLLPFEPKVVEQEAVAAKANARHWVTSEPRRFGARNAAEATALADAATAAVDRHLGIGGSAGSVVDVEGGGVAAVSAGRVAPNLWLVRLTGMLDSAGKQVADHYHALVSFDAATGTIDVMPVGVGESKTSGGTYKIACQMVATFRRLSTQLGSAAELPDMPAGKIAVRWGPRVVAVLQTEEAVPAAHLTGYQAQLRRVSGAPRLDVSLVMLDMSRKAVDARAVVRTAISILMKASGTTAGTR
ncbi:MAG: hypothetical protein ACJ768_06485 [Gaiellaceae bacterium]